MKKMISVFSAILVIALILGSCPLAYAQTENPSYYESFILSVYSEQQKEFTPADFPLVKNLSQVIAVKKTPLGTGFEYYLIMVITTPGVGYVREAKTQSYSYGEVHDNYLAPDYADSQSFVNLNSYRMKLEVGETADLQAIGYRLADNDYAVNGILFTVDPKIVDEAHLMENGYKDFGFSQIYADEAPLTEPLYSGVAVQGTPLGLNMNELSSIHSYVGKAKNRVDLFQIINRLTKQQGVVKAQLYYSHAMHTTQGPHAWFSCDSNDVVSLESGKSFSTVITAMKPGEATVTVNVTAGGKGTATQTCLIMVEENISYATLNAGAVAVPLGETVTLKVNELCLSQSKYQQVGAYVYVNHHDLSYEDFCDAVADWAEGAFPLAIYQEDHQYITYGLDWLEFHHYNGNRASSYFNGVARQRLNTQSPAGEYLIVVNSQQTQGKLLKSLWELDISPRQWVYARMAESPAYAQWTAEDEAVVAVTNTDAYGLSLAVEGKQAGETQVTFTYSDGNKAVTASCFVKVYEPDWPQPKGIGDANADGKIDAKDALAVLRFAVHPHLHFGTVTKENLMEYEKLVWQMKTAGTVGEVDGLQGINARDALQILKYAVKKIDRFPVEDMVTPTDI